MKRLLAMLLCLLMVLTAFPAAAMAEEYVTVTLDANGGYFGSRQTWVIDTETAPIGGTSTKNGVGPGTPHHTDKAFLGWYLTADGSGQEVDPWHFTQTYQKDITFYAKWGALGGSCGDNLTWSYDTATAKLTITGSGKMDTFKWLKQPWASVMDQIKEVSLPEGLTSISYYAFYDCRNLTNVTIPSTVTDIEDRAFIDAGLTSVTIPKSVVNIGEEAFRSCKVTAFKVDSGNANFVSVDGVLLDKNKTRLLSFPAASQITSYTIPATVKSIDDAAFERCKNLTSVTILGSVDTISWQTFLHCDKLTSITIPKGVATIGGEAFCGCSSLTSITLPESVTSIEGGAFHGCSSLTSFTIGKNIEKIGGRAFASCTSLKSFQVASDNPYFTADGNVLFNKDKTELVSHPNGDNYSIPSGIINVRERSFYDSYDLTSISLPVTVTTIGDEAFNFCNKLTDVYYQGTEASKAQIEIGNNNDELLNATWHYGGEAPAAPTATATLEPGATPAPTPTVTPTPTPEPAKTVKVQAKKSVKLQAPKAKGNSYQWYVRANRNAGWQSLGKKGAKDKLSVKATAAMDGYQYRCQVKTATGVVTYTDISELYVYEPLKIKKQPKWGKNSVPGSKMTLSVTAQGADSYQWVMRPNGSSAWTMIEGATAPSYVVNVQEGMAGYQFACRVSGRAGSAQSKAATVKMVKVKPPKVSKQPAWKKAVKPGDWVTLSIKAQNADTYQWYYRTSAKGAWILFSGETKPALTFQVKAGTNGYQYKCTVKGKGGTVDSKPVTLKVVAP